MAGKYKLILSPQGGTSPYKLSNDKKLSFKSKKGLSNSKGFTLIETLVSGMIAVIIAASVFVAFITYDRRARESVSFLKMQRQYDNVAERIAHNARSARTIQPDRPCIYPVTGTGAMTTPGIIMFDENCIELASYRINGSGDTLYEDTMPFQAGGGVVALTAGSEFYLPAARNAVELRLALKSLDRDTTYTMPLRKDLFQCRQ
jgi:hypothetical protein